MIIICKCKNRRRDEKSWEGGNNNNNNDKIIICKYKSRKRRGREEKSWVGGNRVPRPEWDAEAVSCHTSSSSSSSTPSIYILWWSVCLFVTKNECRRREARRLVMLMMKMIVIIISIRWDEMHIGSVTPPSPTLLISLRGTETILPKKRNGEFDSGDSSLSLSFLYPLVMWVWSKIISWGLWDRTQEAFFCPKQCK